MGRRAGRTQWTYFGAKVRSLERFAKEQNLSAMSNFSQVDKAGIKDYSERSPIQYNDYDQNFCVNSDVW